MNFRLINLEYCEISCLYYPRKIQRQLDIVIICSVSSRSRHNPPAHGKVGRAGYTATYLRRTAAKLCLQTSWDHSIKKQTTKNPNKQSTKTKKRQKNPKPHKNPINKQTNKQKATKPSPNQPTTKQENKKQTKPTKHNKTKQTNHPHLNLSVV